MFVCQPDRLVIGACVLLRAEISFSTGRLCFILLTCSVNYVHTPSIPNFLYELSARGGSSLPTSSYDENKLMF
jgi:hypothetical protein